MYNLNGYNLDINNRKTIGQTINHLHIHLIPHYRGVTLASCESM